MTGTLGSAVRWHTMARAGSAAIAAATVGVALGLALATTTQEGREAPVAELSSDHTIWPSGAHPAPRFALRDQGGRLVQLGGARRRSVALTFLDAHCVDQCTSIGRDLSDAWRRLRPDERPLLIVVSANPWNDRPETARAFIERSGWRGEWHWLMGTLSRLRPVWRA